MRGLPGVAQSFPDFKTASRLIGGPQRLERALIGRRGPQQFSMIGGPHCKGRRGEVRCDVMELVFGRLPWAVRRAQSAAGSNPVTTQGRQPSIRHI